jgi:hypothetical protein
LSVKIVKHIDSADPTTWPDWARKRMERRARVAARVAASVVFPDPYDMTRDEFLRGTPAPRARGGHRLLYHVTSNRNAASIVRRGLKAKGGEIWASKKPDGFYGKGEPAAVVVFQVPKDDPLVRGAGVSMVVHRDVGFEDIVMVDPYIEETGKRLSELRDGRYAEKYWDKYFDGAEKRAAVASKVAAAVLTASTSGFMSEYRAKTQDNPVHPDMRVWAYSNDGEDLPLILTEIYPRSWEGEKVIWFSAILSPEKEGKGMGSYVVRQVTKLADKHGVSIWLGAKPFGRTENKLTKSQLVSWYKRNGWETVRGDLMVRRPE